MGAREPSVHTLPHPEATPYLCIERLRIAPATASAADVREVLAGVALSEDGRASLMGAVLLADSLDESWRRLLYQLKDRGGDISQLIISSAPPQLQRETLRAFPRTRWQLPPRAFYERVLQRVHAEQRDRVRRQLRSIHDQPDFIAAEHAAAAALQTLTRLGLWDAAVTLAATYQDTLMFYSLPGGASLPIFRGDAVDRLLEDFLREIAATDQFRGCSITRLDLDPNAEGASDVDGAPAEPQPHPSPAPTTSMLAAASGEPAFANASPVQVVPTPASVTGAEEAPSMARAEHIMPSMAGEHRDGSGTQPPEASIVEVDPSAPIPHHIRDRVADVEQPLSCGLPDSGNDARSAPVRAVRPGTEAARSEPPSDSSAPVGEPTPPAQASASLTTAVDPVAPARFRVPAPAAVEAPARVAPSESGIVTPMIAAPTSVQSTPFETANGPEISETVVAPLSPRYRSEPVRSWTIRYVAAGLTAVAVNVVLVGMVLGLLATDGHGGPAATASQFVRIIEFSPEATPVPRRGGKHRNSTAPSNSGRHAIEMEPRLMALAIPAEPMDLPPLELAPIPSLTRIQTPAPPKRMESTAPPAAVAAGVAPLASTRPDDGHAAGAGAGNGTGHGAGVKGGGSAREAEQGNSAPVYREPPEYPRAALLAGIEGVVTLEFAISESGAVRDPHVVEAVPAGVFDEAALKAIAKWRYSPTSTERHARQSILFSLKR